MNVAALWLALLAAPPGWPTALGPPPDPALPAADRRALLTERARALDARVRFSDRPEWRGLMAWPRPLDTWLTFDQAAPEQSPARFPAPEGMANPAADFAAAVAGAWTDPDFGCRFPLRAEALARAGLGPSPTPLVRGDCPAFERWAPEHAIDGIEVIFATPSWREPATTAGHILFRVRARPDRADAAPPGEAILSYGVDLARPEAATDRLFKGLVGLLRGEVLLEDTRSIDWRYGVVDRRDLWVYDLELSARERRMLLARLWVQRRDDSHGGYSFFSVNCARLTHDTVRMLVPELGRARGWFMHPHEVIGALWRAGRLRPRGVVYSRRTKARRGERARDDVADALAALPGFTAAHAALDGPPEARAQALAAVGDPADPALRAALTRWADATLDVEMYAVDVATDNDPRASSPSLDAALALRARLPPATARRLEPFPEHAIGPGGSRRATFSAGTDGARPVTRMRTGVIDEQPGEPRAVALRRSSRFEFLVGETTLAWPTRDVTWPAVLETRLVLLSTVDHAVHVRAIDGRWASRLDLLVDLGLHTAPAHGAWFGGWARVGQGFTAWAADDDTGFVVLGLDGQIVGAGGADRMVADPLRGELGAWLEVIAPMGSGHAFRLTGRGAPGFGLDGFATHAMADARLDLLLDGRRAIVLAPYGRVRRGGLTGDGWEAGLSLSL